MLFEHKSLEASVQILNSIIGKNQHLSSINSNDLGNGEP